MSNQNKDFQQFDQVTLDYGNVKLRGIIAKISNSWPAYYTIHVLQKTNDNEDYVGTDYMKKLDQFQMYMHVSEIRKADDKDFKSGKP